MRLLGIVTKRQDTLRRLMNLHFRSAVANEYLKTDL